MENPSKKKTNRLAQETSPYLRQHAHNPVDWYPWGPEALEKAKEANKPIFLSIGYSACHWCHVMERESFENEEIARFLNEQFISVKVDREERPDIDQIYMNVVQLMTGHGGWPMSIILSPDQVPIFAGTYFPPQDYRGMPGFSRILTEALRMFKESPPELQKQTASLMNALNHLSKLPQETQNISEEKLLEAAKQVLRAIDWEYGGFGGAPKFPQTMALSFLLRIYERTHEKEFLEAVTLTLTTMAEGGIYDHLAGGFSRYSVDERWAIPHFEKMLYDNALLSVLYFEAFQVTKNEFFKQIGCEILDYVLNHMISPEGAFFSSEDADSEGVEGKFYVWDPEEIKNILGEKEGKTICHYFGVDQAGNFEDRKTVLAIKRSVAILSKEEGLSKEEIEQILQEGKEKLFKVREKRIPPGKDDKILTSWNALMIRGFVKGFWVSGEKKYLDTAIKASSFILNVLVDQNQTNRLLVTAKDGKAKLKAYLDDYAFVIASFLDLFEATADFKWFQKAKEFQQTIIDHFKDSKGPGYYFTADDHETLIHRSKSFQDGSIPSGNSILFENIIRFHMLTREDHYQKLLQDDFEPFFALACKQPLGMTNHLVAADFYLGPRSEIVLLSGEKEEEFHEMSQTLGSSFFPRAIRISVSNDSMKDKPSNLPQGLEEILRGKEPKEGKATVFFCKGSECSEPLNSIHQVKQYFEENINSTWR